MYDAALHPHPMYNPNNFPFHISTANCTRKTHRRYEIYATLLTLKRVTTVVKRDALSTAAEFCGCDSYPHSHFLTHAQFQTSQFEYYSFFQFSATTKCDNNKECNCVSREETLTTCSRFLLKQGCGK